MKKTTIIIVHIVFWLLIWSLNFSFSFFNPSPQAFSDFMIRAISLFFYMIDFYIVYLLLIPSFFIRKKHVKFIIYAALFCIGYTLAFHIIYEKAGNLLGINSGGRMFSISLLTDFYYIVLYMILGGFFRFTVDGFNYMRIKDQLEKQNLTSELALLRSQVNPHFLFNTLNNIHSMIHVSPENAADSIIKLSGIMRYMLYDSSTELVALEKEISFLESYISLLEIRVKKRNYITSDISAYPNGILIAPMLLVPFIENAYKHGNKSDNISGIKIKLNITKDQLDFNIENTIVDEEINDKDSTSGIGLLNIKRRLELIYPEKHFLNISQRDNIYIVELKLELK